MPAPGFFHNLATRFRLKLTDEEKERIFKKQKKLDKKLKVLIETEKKHLSELKKDTMDEAKNIVKPLTKLGFTKEAISQSTARVARIKALAKADATRTLADEAFKKKDFVTYKSLLAKLKKYDKNAESFSRYIQKAAKLSVESLERHLGTYFSDDQEETVRRMIGQHKSQSYALRHPKLTGALTLGRAPAIAERDAKRAITRSLLKKNLKMQRDYKEKQKMDIARQRAEIPKEVANKALIAAMSAATAGKLLTL